MAAKVVGRHEYVDPREVINDIDLDEVIYILSALYPERGERMIIGFVRARNREQVRAYLKIVSLKMIVSVTGVNITC